MTDTEHKNMKQIAEIIAQSKYDEIIEETSAILDICDEERGAVFMQIAFSILCNAICAFIYNNKLNKKYRDDFIDITILALKASIKDMMKEHL